MVEIWFGAVVLLWLGFLLLEGFDFGVAMLLPVLGRDEHRRSLMLRTIGPVWDGNEVWLITAVGATFAAFPGWYASWLSSSYLLFVLVLLALIARAVGIEWRHAHHAARWERGWSVALAAGSAVAALGIGAALGAATLGLPLAADGNRAGGPLAWLNTGAVLGAVAVAGFCVVHGALFLALRTNAPLRDAATRLAHRLLPAAATPLLAWGVITQIRDGTLLTWTLWTLGPLAAGYAWRQARAGRSGEGRAFAAWAVLLATSVAAIFAAGWPVVLQSTAGPDLTAHAATVSPQTLTVMTWVAAFGLPAVLAYQAWSYWVFRRRVGGSV